LISNITYIPFHLIATLFRVAFFLTRAWKETIFLLIFGCPAPGVIYFCVMFFQVVSKVNDFGNSWKVSPSCGDVSGTTHHDHAMPEPPECAHVFGGATPLRYNHNKPICSIILIQGFSGL
jgi:hypothetical protein